ncbi:MAG: M56 family metallopeptidase [Oscillibacter sp.]|nr:M56 family metallopeptidase [Oscillibacter sp.]
MREVLLTSSALILALLAVRKVFREKISRCAQYALWGLALLRLLIPANLPAVNFSLLSVSEPARAQIAERLEKEPVYVLPVSTREIAVSSSAPNVIPPVEGRYSAVKQEEGRPAVLTEYAFTLEEALELVWKTGMAGMAAWLVILNFGLWRRLRKNRIPLDLPECEYPVYLVEEGLVSPCLFGLFRPAVYLTPAALESEESLRHVLAHEETHARHLDPLWSLLRNVCLTVYWFHPLVWWAAAASKEDCELACDEGALRRLGADERVPYGQTLLRLIPVRKSVGGVLVAATTMTSDKKRLKERITRIAENRKTKAAALCAALAVTAAVCAVTFTGCAAAEEPAEAPAAPVDPVNAAEPDEAVLTIPLTDLSPYAPVKVVPLPADTPDAGHHHGDHHQNRLRAGGGCRTTENCGTFVWNYGGNTYVSSHDLRLSSYPDSYFLVFPEQEYQEEPFTGLLGYNGVKITYQVELETGECTVNDYYIFEESGDSADIYLLARTYGQSETADIDGDGELELIAGDFLKHCQLIFRRDGRLYEADIHALVHENWPGTGDFTGFLWSPEENCLHIFYSLFSSDSRQDRQLRFDGENLLLYK